MAMQAEEIVVTPPSKPLRAVPSPPRARVLDLDALRQPNATKRWEELVQAAIEPNVFFEPWYLLASLESFGSERVEVVVVERHDGQWLGLFPLVRTPRYRGLPGVAALSLFEHDYTPLSTPLVHAQLAHECLNALLEWMRESSGAHVLELTQATGDGPFHHAVLDVLFARGEQAVVVEWHTRGLLVTRPTADAYFAHALRADNRRKIKAKDKKLAERGAVAYEEVGTDVDAWTRTFLEIEQSGWKGKRGTAMSAKDADRTFFGRVVREAHARGRLMGLSLTVDGKPVAMKCNFLAGDGGAYAFKIAYDEAFASASPGILLEVENVKRSHARGIRWMDSCAKPTSRMFVELWCERRAIETLALPVTHAGALAVAAMPLLRVGLRVARDLVRDVRSKLTTRD